MRKIFKPLLFFATFLLPNFRNIFAILFARNVGQDGCRTGGTQDKDVQDRRDAGNEEGSRTGEMQDMRDAAREGCGKGGM